MCDSDGIGLARVRFVLSTLSSPQDVSKGAANTKKYVFTYSKEEVKSTSDSEGIKHVTYNPDKQHLDPSGVEQNTTTYSTPLGSLDYHLTRAIMCDSDGIGLARIRCVLSTLRYVLRTTQGAGAIDTFPPFPGRAAEGGSFLFRIESTENHLFRA